MICPICRGSDVQDGRTAVKFERSEMRLVVQNVPARLCLSCGETYVSEDVAVELLRITKDLSQAGILSIEYEYSWGANKGTKP